MKKGPVKLQRIGDNVEISAFIDFTGNSAGKMLDAGLTYGEAAAACIERKWSGEFCIYGRKVNVTTSVYSGSYSPNSLLKPAVNAGGQSFIKMKITGGTIASRIMRSHERLSLAGILKNDESITSWSASKSSTPIVIYLTENFQGDNPGKSIGRTRFEGLVAHEFGHALGLGDAYNAGYRGGSFPWTLDGCFAPKSYRISDKSGNAYTVSVPDNDMMIYGGKVSDNDMRMVLEAFETDIQQFFPLGSKDWSSR